MSNPRPRRAALMRGSSVGPAQRVRGNKNRVLMACSDMEEGGKWTEIFMKKNGSEHLLSPHALIFPQVYFWLLFPRHRQLLQIESLAPAGPGLQPSSEGGRPWMMIVCVWRFNWKTFPEVERHTEEVISSSFSPQLSVWFLRGGTRYSSGS